MNSITVLNVGLSYEPINNWIECMSLTWTALGTYIMKIATIISPWISNKIMQNPSTRQICWTQYPVPQKYTSTYKFQLCSILFSFVRFVCYTLYWIFFVISNKLSYTLSWYLSFLFVHLLYYPTYPFIL